MVSWNGMDTLKYLKVAKKRGEGGYEGVQKGYGSVGVGCTGGNLSYR